MKTNLSQVYLAQATQCQAAASQAVLANVREKNERAEASWRAMAVRELDREAERPAQRAVEVPRSICSAELPEIETETAEEFDGLDNDLVNVGKFIGREPTEPKDQKNPQTPVDEAFGIDSKNLYRPEESAEPEKARGNAD